MSTTRWIIFGQLPAPLGYIHPGMDGGIRTHVPLFMRIVAELIRG